MTSEEKKMFDKINANLSRIADAVEKIAGKENKVVIQKRSCINWDDCCSQILGGSLNCSGCNNYLEALERCERCHVNDMCPDKSQRESMECLTLRSSKRKEKGDILK